MPLLMSSTFAPDGEGDYLLLTQDHGAEPARRSRATRKHDADAYDQYSHDMEMVCQAIKPLHGHGPAGHLQRRPRGAHRAGRRSARASGSMDKRVLHNAVRLLTGSAADFLDDYFESDLLKGYLASSSIIGTKVGPRSQGSGLVLLYHSIGEHDGEFGAWAFHKRGNGGFTQVLARAAQSFGAEIILESPVEDGHHQGRPGDRRRPQRTAPSTTPTPSSARSTRGGRSSSSSTRASCRTTSSRTSSASASRARRRRSTSPSTACPSTRPWRDAATSSAASRTSARRWTTSSAPSTTRSTAGTASARTSTWRSSRRSTPTWRLPASTSCRASSSTRRTSCARATGTPRRRTWATPSRRRSSRSSRASATWSSSARSSPRSHIERTVGLARATSSPASSSPRRCSSSGRRPGWSQYRTPIDGYYQCGSGTHPGGCVMGAPGKLAAGQILKDRAKAGVRAKA